jgi:hypothetical protein
VKKTKEVSLMKEMKISFTISISLKQTDIHWIEEELLKKREEVFIEAMKGVMEWIEREAIKGKERCPDCGMGLVNNGRGAKKIMICPRILDRYNDAYLWFLWVNAPIFG